MKKKTIIIGLLLLLVAGVSAQSERYMELMKESIGMMDSENSMVQLLQAANQFERIGIALQEEWLPYYYAAYCHVQISHHEKKDRAKDLHIDKAEELNFRANQISPDNSEIYVMKGFILQAKMSVEPMVRGLKYNKECLDMFRKAKEMDPENPRSYLWHGVNLYNTPAYMGGGKKNALPLLDTALLKFDTYPLLSEIHPDWGKSYADSIRNECLKK